MKWGAPLENPIDWIRSKVFLSVTQGQTQEFPPEKQTSETEGKLEAVGTGSAPALQTVLETTKRKGQVVGCHPPVLLNPPQA